MEFGCFRSVAAEARRGSASSHGPTRKLTHVSASVKGNIVNTNVYNISHCSVRPRRSWILAHPSLIRAGYVGLHFADDAVSYIVDNMIEWRTRFGHSWAAGEIDIHWAMAQRQFNSLRAR
jgi:hypothetical protein